MTKIPSNFSKSNMKYECYCGNEENMKHIFYCKSLSNGIEHRIEYEKIYNGTVTEQKEILTIFERNMKRRTWKRKLESMCSQCRTAVSNDSNGLIIK